MTPELLTFLDHIIDEYLQAPFIILTALGYIMTFFCLFIIIRLLKKSLNLKDIENQLLQINSTLKIKKK